METIPCKHIKAKGKPEWTPLFLHLKDVAFATEVFAKHRGFDHQIARYGGLLHDIGKASKVFQDRLIARSNDQRIFRHEIASCLFLSLFDKTIHPPLIEMIIGHHKSIKTPNDTGAKGILDLEENRDDNFKFHSQYWDLWLPDALHILKNLGVPVKEITITEANENYNRTVIYCENIVLRQGYSEWRGILMGGDHFTSALDTESFNYVKRIFQVPDLGYYDRKHPLYPLSKMSAVSEKQHTIAVACTGAGKTDFLLRRCKGRVFYVLPFQASINAMYKRIKNDLSGTNPEVDIRLLHASSQVVLKNGKPEEKTLQGHIGSSIKVLTPHQIASIIFGLAGYEAIILDIKGSDVILDEIHTYTDVTRAIVFKIVQVLKHLNCRIHIGTATMPSVLYNQVISILEHNNTLEIKLSDIELAKFNRHIVHKLNNWEDGIHIVRKAVESDQKVLLVCNRVEYSQNLYKQLQDIFEDIPLLLLHSRFRRSDRNEKERMLIGMDENCKSTKEFNTSDTACIVISTQVVEVSLDISFDVMITETAPIDALIQRFGRINRKRNESTIGKFKPVYVIKPPVTEKEAKPYGLNVLQQSYDVLPDGEVLDERDLQSKIDFVFPEIDSMNIEQHAIFKEDGQWRIDMLTHRSKSVLFELLEIDSVSCICESDQVTYMNASYDERMEMEIPARYFAVSKLRQSSFGNKPFILPDIAYNNETGLHTGLAKPANYSTFEIL